MCASSGPRPMPWGCLGSRATSPHARSSRRQWLARLLAHHVFGVPGWPVGIGLAGALLVLAVGRRGAAQGVSQVAGRGVGRLRRDAAREAIGDLLQEPAVAVGV